jgi:hypothetical protein
MACLRLAKSSNPNEAALAAAKAQDIIDRYKLDTSAMDYDAEAKKQDDEKIEDFGSAGPIDEASNHQRWCLTLATTVASSNQCYIYYAVTAVSGYNIRIIGRPSDVGTVRYMYAYLKAEAMRLKKENCAGHSSTYGRQFCLGVVDAIRVKLLQHRAETVKKIKDESAAQGMALVRVNNAVARLDRRMLDVRQWVEGNMKIRKVAGGRTDNETGARYRGQIAGQQIRIGGARASIGN